MLAEALAEDRRALLAIRVAGEEVEAAEPRRDRLVALDGLREASADDVERLLARDGDGDVRGLLERGEAILDDRRELRLDVEDAKEAVDLVLAPVDRLEHGGGGEAMLARGEELLERRAARLLLRVVGERALERLDRGVLIAGACKIHVSEASEDRGSLLGGRELRRRARALLASSGHWRCASRRGIHCA